VVKKYSGQSNTPNRAVFQKTDVVDWEQLERMFDVAVGEFGDVDIVCPGAGIYEPVCCARLILPPLHILSCLLTACSTCPISGDLPGLQKAVIHKMEVDTLCWIST
jgi:NAD(P)-dependent dehydrogenase (short-subunit alcohol dehydrogenase family)